MNDEKKILRALWLLIIISAAARAFIAGFIELGNDEVYYRLYAEFPALSHFDHPPMVGWVIQLFTLNLSLHHEFFLRLASVMIGTVNTWLIFMIGRYIKDSLTGLYAAILYTTSLYAFVITGIFILPDTPQNLFWLLSIYFLIRSLPSMELTRTNRYFMLAAGVTTGLALLSKYSSAALLSGAFFFILFHNRKWFSAKETWIAFLLAILLFVPVIAWNINNDFISFTFHESRITPGKTMPLHPDYFGTEVIGQIFYNNPVNVMLIITAMIAWVRRKRFMNVDYFRLLMWICMPLTLVFLGFSLFRQTLPHWSGPAYSGFILIAAAWLADTSIQGHTGRLVPGVLRAAIIFLAVLLTLAVGQIRFGWIPLERWKVRDITYDLYGWRQLGPEFKTIAEKDNAEGVMTGDPVIFSWRWFPAANMDYYLGREIPVRLYALGTLERIHKYYWIDKERGPVRAGSDVYFLALSDDFVDPASLYVKMFDTIMPPDTINILRGQELVRQVYVYRMKGLKTDYNP